MNLEHPTTRRANLRRAKVFLVLAIWTAFLWRVDYQWSVRDAAAAARNQPVVQQETPESPKTPEPPPAPQKATKQGNAAPSSKPHVIKNARITHYEAVPEQTDSTPCVGAMPGVDFCEPPFPIVANNCLKLGTKVEIAGRNFTVADRMASRYGCDRFDVLNGSGLPDHADVEVL